MNTKLPRQFGFWSVAMLALAWAFGPACAAAQENPVKIGAVTFLSGAAAGPFGVPARNGAEIIVESCHALVRDDHGQPAAILEINRDVTARKHGEEALRESEQWLRYGQQVT